MRAAGPRVEEVEEMMSGVVPDLTSEDDQKTYCLLEAFTSGSIALAANYYRNYRNSVQNKDPDDRRRDEFKMWSKVVESKESIITVEEETSKLNLTYPIDDMEVCRAAWCWIHGISVYRVKQFAKEYKSEMLKQEVIDNKRKAFTDNTYISLPYQSMKAIFDELKIQGSFSLRFLY